MRFPRRQRRWRDIFVETRQNEFSATELGSLPAEAELTRKVLVAEGVAETKWKSADGGTRHG